MVPTDTFRNITLNVKCPDVISYWDNNTATNTQTLCNKDLRNNLYILNSNLSRTVRKCKYTDGESRENKSMYKYVNFIL